MTRTRQRLGLLLALVGAGLGTSALAKASLGLFQEPSAELPLFGAELGPAQPRPSATPRVAPESTARPARPNIEIVDPWAASFLDQVRAVPNADKAKATAAETLRVQEVVDPWRAGVAAPSVDVPVPIPEVTDPWARSAAPSASGGTYVIQEIIDPWSTAQ